MSETQISAISPVGRGRPIKPRLRPRDKTTLYDPKVGLEIAWRVSEGEPFQIICKSYGLSSWTAYDWLEREPGFAEMYVKAKERLAHKFAVEIITIADDESIDPNSRRVRCDARKWAAAKLLPKVYSDKHIIAGDPDNPIEHRISVMTAEERRAEIGKLTNDLLKLAGPIIDAKAEPGEES